MPYQDGTFTSAVQNGPKQIFYPFLNSPTKDSTTKGTIRTMVSLPNYYATLAALSTDPDDATQYLIEETEPSIDSAIARWQRTYCKVPGDQVTYGSRVITKPLISSLPGVTQVAAYILYGDSTLSQSYLYIPYLNYVWGTNNKVYGQIATTTSANNGANTDVTWTSHGLAGTETIIVTGGSGFSARYVVFASGTYTVVNANTIRLTGVNYGTLGINAAKYYRAYTPGTDRVGTRNTQKFYLPSVTPGIATAADIPIPSTLLNDSDFIASVIANTSGYQTYDANELGTWRGPIYTQTLTDINMADV